MRVVQAADGTGFTLEAFPALGIICEVFGQDLDGNRAVQTGVGGTIHFSHTARTQLIADFESYNRIWCLGRLKKSGVSG